LVDAEHSVVGAFVNVMVLPARKAARI